MTSPSFCEQSSDRQRVNRGRLFRRTSRIAAACSIALTFALPTLASAATAPVSPYMENKADFIYNFMFVFGVHPDPGQHSPFTDVPTKSWAWGWVHQALDLGIVAPVSNTQFGASDPVSEAEAAAMAVQYFHVPLKSQETATAWANSLGLFAGVQNANALTLHDELVFLQRLQGYHVGVQPTPSGWRVSNQDANRLITAMTASAQSVSTQEQLHFVVSRNAVLTSAGKKDFQAQALARQLQLTSNMQFGVNRGRWEGLASVAEQIGGSVSQSGQPSSMKMQEYINGDVIYVNQGSGWQQLPGGQGLLSLVQQDLQSGNYLTADGLSNVTVAQTKSDYTYHGALSAQGLKVFAAQVTTAMQLPTSAAATVDQAIMKTASSSLVVNTANVQGKDVLTGDSVHVKFILPPQLLGGPGTSQNPTVQRLIKEVQSIVVQETVTGAYTYNSAPVPPPASLLTSMAKKA